MKSSRPIALIMMLALLAGCGGSSSSDSSEAETDSPPASPAKLVREIIGKSSGKIDLEGPSRIATVPGRSDLVYVNGRDSHNAFRIDLSTEPPKVIQIIDFDGDGVHKLSFPTGLDVDSRGNVYITGYGSNNVFRITPRGRITQIIDAGGDGMGNELLNASRVAVDLDGLNVYVTGMGSHNAFHIALSEDGDVLGIEEIIDVDGDHRGALLISPNRIVVNYKNLNVYVEGQSSHNVFRITPAGAISEIIDIDGDGVNQLLGPFGLHVQQYGDKAGDVYVSGQWSHNVFRYSIDTGAIEQILDNGGSGQENLLWPADIWVDALGRAYVNGFLSGNTFRVDPSGEISVVLNATLAEHAFERPEGVVVGYNPYRLFVTGFDSNNAYEVVFP